MSHDIAAVPGGECPHCHYHPLYEDAGFIVCVGCDAKFEAQPGAVEQDLDEEE